MTANIIEFIFRTELKMLTKPVIIRVRRENVKVKAKVSEKDGNAIAEDIDSTGGICSVFSQLN